MICALFIFYIFMLSLCITFYLKTFTLLTMPLQCPQLESWNQSHNYFQDLHPTCKGTGNLLPAENLPFSSIYHKPCKSILSHWYHNKQETAYYGMFYFHVSVKQGRRVNGKEIGTCGYFMRYKIQFSVDFVEVVSLFVWFLTELCRILHMLDS